jgi:presenilin-like A22 family membrane protease
MQPLRTWLNVYNLVSVYMTPEMFTLIEHGNYFRLHSPLLTCIVEIGKYYGDPETTIDTILTNARI